MEDEHDIYNDPLGWGKNSFKKSSNNEKENKNQVVKDLKTKEFKNWNEKK